ncbi:NAD(P)-dependent oxidoreductase [Mycobacterium sp. Aquia_216]|uniref:NAD-dependent epimerase/dehydratase family protein n=1 Tax=Mycobacterium sp. Aquia_216 TaxID=2991729 RepID=UPI00227C3E70|nr:NAD(P)-dependent oxidoreductase [Mycobacterium sp. Aquia_216]WAJ44411.1 NAD(P)-dependent oxidoreductase [Mycobacterium sp. Aquia_216]
MSNPVLITGAFGQVGKRCTEILLSRGRTVIATDLRTDTVVAIADKLGRGKHPGTLKTVYADLLDAAFMADLIAEQEPSAIVHLAGMYSPPSYRNPRLARRVNVEGTTNLVRAAESLSVPPLVVFASSAAVYGSRNPYRYPERITAQTPVNPIDQYGEDKVLAEAVIQASALPYALLRLGGIISPDGAANLNSDYLLLMRATPGDTRLHTIDARDAALAFANAVDRGDIIDSKTLLIAGDETHLHEHRDVEDDIFEAVGIGRLGPGASLPGNRQDDRGWGFTGWFDTTESQALLDYHRHDWPQTVAWVAESQSRPVRVLLRALGPALRPALRIALAAQRRIERRGPYADPWTLIAAKYGPEVLATTHETPS